MHVYITKYALTSGIQVRELDEDTTSKLSESPKRIVCKAAQGERNFWLVWTPDWYKTLEEAQARAEEMRKKKIASLERQLEKLKTMKIEVIECLPVKG